jgi:hypothetical protein
VERDGTDRFSVESSIIDLTTERGKLVDDSHLKTIQRDLQG